MNVYNSLENEAVSIHWHGMWQHGTPWMDGTSMITQCPILPSNSFTYRFIAQVCACTAVNCVCVWREGVPAKVMGLCATPISPLQPAGTHSWHAHHGMERPDGVFGALIVHKKPSVEEQRDSICDVDNQLLILSEWYHETSPELYWKRISSGFFEDGAENPPFAWTRSVDGRLVRGLPTAALHSPQCVTCACPCAGC